MDEAIPRGPHRLGELRGEARAHRTAQAGEGALYLAIVAVELLLKTAICRNLNQNHFPSAVFIHVIEELLIVAGLRKELEAERNATG